MLPHRGLARCILSGLALLPVPAAAARTLADCQAQFAARPDARESSECFADVGAQGKAQEAEQQVEALLVRHPHHPWLLFNLGSIRWSEPARAAGPFRAAAVAQAARGDALGEILARIALHSVLTKLGRPAEAAEEVQRVAAIAQRSGDPLLVARAEVLEAKHLRQQGQDLERAFLLLRRAHEAAFPNGTDGLKRDCLDELANVSLSLGRLAEERAAYQQLAELAVSTADHRTEAIARYGTLRTLVEELLEVPRPEGRREATELAQGVLAVATAVGYRELAGRAHLVLARLGPGDDTAREHVDQCLAILSQPKDRSLCWTALSKLQRQSGDLAAAQTSVREALALADQAQDPWARLDAWRESMRVSWEALPPEQALANSRSALGEIETIRDRQRSESSRAGLSSIWSENYYWLSGRLLETGNADRLNDAFGAMERLRARTLVEALAAARAAAGPPSPLLARQAMILGNITQVQRRLLVSGMPEADRSQALRDLRRLEIEEAEVRNLLAAAAPAPANPPGFAVLPQVRQALAADEALLSFQVSPDEDLFRDFGGGSWLLVSTRSSTRVVRLPRDRVALRPAVALFNGLFERRDGAEIRPAVGLYRDLLAAGLASLPPTVRRLVIVPDDALHLLPFAALRRSADEPPLVARYEISVVPSATLWLHWRTHRPPTAAEPLLALADPRRPGDSAESQQRATERAAIFADGLRLGALPFARQEGQSAVRHLDAGSVLRVGGEASEGFIKHADLRHFAILHFATHAVLDDQHPERSGVLLTARPASEDGLLQIREIVALPLDGRIVVLSSCRSATGQMLRGEGVMGMARAFFQAGAHTVVASLWPLRDDDGAALFDRFYTHLAEGKSVAAALRAAQRDRIEAGAPAYAWAGLLVLGDGGLIPLPGGRKGLDLPPWVTIVAAGAALLGVGLAVIAWRRRYTTVL
ncbi:MAG TPA: CHAT domain-containing protein [Thermoanaerobaculia bacterium]|jgi:tetratricopeptide (TPR) repeat protein|nr:CHAT domain-containing protein [Thermoanaerobaculia bacterium]